ncbi:MAG: HAD family hydrolase [Dehalococcoidia bacterium]
MATRTIQACVFDMDGVLLDSEPLHHQAVNEILVEEGRAGIPFVDYAPYMGTTLEYTWLDLIKRYELPQPLAYYRDRYDAVILDHYRRSSTIAIGVNWFIGELRARDLRLAVASSSRTEWVESCLCALGLREYFEVVVTGDMVLRSKPDPEIYLIAAARLQTSPNCCMAIEDAPKGIAAAKAAGMFTVAVETAYTAGEDTSAADLHVHSLADFDLPLLDALLSGGSPM